MKSSDLSNRHPIRRAWIIHSLVGVLYACLVCAIFYPWLRPFHQPQRGGPELRFRAGDLTPLFSVWTQVAARSMFERGEWPLWSDHIYCGEPFFAKPQIGVISLTTLLCALLPAQVVATWTFLLHLWIAGMATYAWCLDVLRLGGSGSPAEVSIRRAAEDSRPHTPCAADGTRSVPTTNHLAAACGGAVFMLSGLMIEHTMIGHGPIVLVACWTPLVLRMLGRAFLGGRPVRSATLAGLLVAVQLLAGGETMFLYNVLAGGLLGLAWIGGGWGSRLGPAAAWKSGTEPVQFVEATGSPNLAHRLLRVVAVGAIVGLTGFGLSAIKVLPGLAVIPVSNRAGGLLLEDAAGFIPEFREPAVLRVWMAGLGEKTDFRSLFAITMVLGAVGLIAAWRTQPLRWLALAALLLLVVGIAISHSQAVFGFLWRVLPMFRYQRIPQRALVLAYLGLCVLVSVGAHRLLALRLIRDTFSASCRRQCVVGCVLFVGISLESWFALPPLPPTADIRREVGENRVLNYLAKQPGQFRIHAVESMDRNWGIEHVTMPLGLSNLAGWDHLWLLEYLGAEGTVGRDVRPFLTASYQAQHPARFWGMMNVRFVTATRPIDVPGLQLVSEFPVSPSSQPAKSAGPYLYENELCMPRAWIVPHAILVLGDRAERLEAVYSLLDHPEFQPTRAVIIHPEQGVDAFSPTELAQFDAVILPRRWLKSETGERLKRIHGVEPFHGPTLSYFQWGGRVFWDQPDDVDKLLSELATDGSSDLDAADSKNPDAPEIEFRGSSRVKLRLSRQRGYLVLAEKFAHFPGWHEFGSDAPHDLHKANAVATALRLREYSERPTINLAYCPAGIVSGSLISLLSALMTVVLFCFGDRLASGSSTLIL